jgi:heparin binding hemagglutinin HbhA
MPNVPTIDVRKAGEQAKAIATTAFEQARTPLLAAIGAGDVATQAVIDAVNKARAQLTERAGQARTAATDLPTDLGGLRERLDPAELRKLVDQYADSALKLYQYLSEHGQETLAKLRNQPQVKRAVEQFDQAATAAQHRAEAAVEDARELADEVLGRVVRRTRSAGDKAASVTEQVAETVSEEVLDLGGEAAHELRSATRKTASRTNAARPKATGTGSTGTSGTTRKPTGQK